MNIDASNASGHEGESVPRSGVFAESESGATDRSGEQPDVAVTEDAATNTQAEPVTAELVRVGSPFAVDPFAPSANRPIEAFYDVGPLRYR